MTSSPATRLNEASVLGSLALWQDDVDEATISFCERKSAIQKVNCENTG